MILLKDNVACSMVHFRLSPDQISVRILDIRQDKTYGLYLYKFSDCCLHLKLLHTIVLLAVIQLLLISHNLPNVAINNESKFKIIQKNGLISVYNENSTYLIFRDGVLYSCEFETSIGRNTGADYYESIVPLNLLSVINRNMNESEC